MSMAIKLLRSRADLKIACQHLKVGSLSPADALPERFADFVADNEKDAAAADSLLLEPGQTVLDKHASKADVAAIGRDSQMVEVPSSAVVAAEHRSSQLGSMSNHRA